MVEPAKEVTATKEDNVIVFNCVVRGSTILTSYQTAPTDGSFEREVKVVLDLLVPAKKIKRNGRHTFIASRHKFYCLFRKGMVYMVASEPDTEKKAHFEFLGQVKKQFIGDGLMSSVAEANEHSLNAKFKNRLTELTLKYYNVGPSLATLEADLNEVKITIGQCYDQMMERGENLNYLTNKARTLETAAQSFQTTGQTLKSRECCFFTAWRIGALVISGIVFITVLMIILWFSGALGSVPVFLEPDPFPVILGGAAVGNEEEAA